MSGPKSALENNFSGCGPAVALQDAGFSFSATHVRSTTASGVCANECQGPNQPWRMTFLVAALQWHCRMRGFLQVGSEGSELFFDKSNCVVEIG